MRAVLEDLSAVNAVGRVVLPRRAASPPRVRVATTTYKQSQADDATTNSGPVRAVRRRRFASQASVTSRSLASRKNDETPLAHL